MFLSSWSGCNSDILQHCSIIFHSQGLNLSGVGLNDGDDLLYLWRLLSGDRDCLCWDGLLRDSRIGHLVIRLIGLLDFDHLNCFVGSVV